MLDVVAAVRRGGATGRVLLTSFDLDLVDALAESAPDLELGYLAAQPLQRRHPGVRTWSLHHAVVLGSPQLMAEARHAGIRVLAWTVDEVRLAHRLVKCGVAGLISNHPERFVGSQGLRF